jgi:hypothetical protein
MADERARADREYEARREDEARQVYEAHLLRGARIGELHTLPEAELVERHDSLVAEANRTRTPNLQWLERAQVYADELTRRETARQGERMEGLTRSLNRLTQWIVVLTVIVVVATLVGVGLTAWTVLSGG